MKWFLVSPKWLCTRISLGLFVIVRRSFGPMAWEVELAQRDEHRDYALRVGYPISIWQTTTFCAAIRKTRAVAAEAALEQLQ